MTASYFKLQNSFSGLTINYFSVLLSLAEVVLAFVLVMWVHNAVASLISASLFVAFFAFHTLDFGQKLVEDCGCFGTVSVPRLLMLWGTGILSFFWLLSLISFKGTYRIVAGLGFGFLAFFLFVARNEVVPTASKALATSPFPISQVSLEDFQQDPLLLERATECELPGNALIFFLHSGCSACRLAAHQLNVLPEETKSQVLVVFPKSEKPDSLGFVKSCPLRGGVSLGATDYSLYRWRRTNEFSVEYKFEFETLEFRKVAN